MNKINNKKTKILLLIGTITFLIVLLGATYAYFSVLSSNNTTKTKTQGNLQSIGDITLETNTSNLYINLDGILMSEVNAGERYFATNEATGTPIASTDATLGNGIYTLATASLASGDTKYNCNYTYDIVATVKTPITDNSDSDIKVKFTLTNGGTVEYTLKDLTAGAKELTGDFNNLTSGSSQTITIESTVENTANKQDDFAGNNYTITITPKSGTQGFSCEIAPDLNDPKLLTNKLVADNAMWESGLEEDGYRFIGSGAATASTTPNNFICFGTSDKTECKNNEDKYLYRIIGVFEDNAGVKHTKLIKYQALASTYKWNVNNQADVVWEASDLYKGLNGSYFLNNTTYSYLQNPTWLNKIANWSWSAANTKREKSSGPSYYSGVTTKEMYLHEMNRTGKTNLIGTWTTPSAKIGLMYASDYQMSLGTSALNYIGSSNSSTLKTGWMHINNNGLSPSEPEWTNSRYGSYISSYYVWYVSSSGNVNHHIVSNKYAVRPVFYLESNVKYNSGIGTYDNPIMIK